MARSPRAIRCMPTFDVPDTFDPNNLGHLLTLVDNLRAARCRHVEHPSGLKMDFETRRDAPVVPPGKPGWDE